MDSAHARQWLETGNRIAKGFSDKLDDRAAGISYSKYFYVLYLFDGDNGVGPVSIDVLQYAMRQLTRRRASISSSSPLKELLGTYLSLCTMFFQNEQTRQDAAQTLKQARMIPSAVEVLGEKMGNRFVGERYDEKVSERMHLSKDALNLWQRANWLIMSLGEWFKERLDSGNAVSAIGMLACSPLVISLVVWVFSTFSDHGMFWGILSLIAALVAGYWGCIIIFFIAAFISAAVLWVLRYVFYNIYTFLATVGLILWLLLS
jgi:hypothetical protein